MYPTSSEVLSGKYSSFAGMSTVRVACTHASLIRSFLPLELPSRGGQRIHTAGKKNRPPTSTSVARKRHVPSSGLENNSGGRGNSMPRFTLVKVAAGLVWIVSVTHCVREHVGETYVVSGPSMRPTIEHNSCLLINKMAVRGLPLQRGQVVVARSPVDTGRMVVKRVTALPGDAVRVVSPAWDVHNALGIETRLEVVPEGHVWLAGDNKDNSKDSRNYGAVPQALVDGVVVLRLWPPIARVL